MPRWALGIAACAAAQPFGAACAGPWITDREELVIVSAAPNLEGRGGAIDGYGETILSPRRMSLTSRSYGERGPLGARLESDLGLKLALRPTPWTSVAAEIGPALVQDAADRCAGAGGYATVAAGRSFRGGYYAAAEASHRGFGARCAGARGGLTFGRSGARSLALAQAFYDVGPGGDEVVRGQISAVRFWRGVGLQLGVRARLAPEAGEPAAVIGLWVRGRAAR